MTVWSVVAASAAVIVAAMWACRCKHEHKTKMRETREDGSLRLYAVCQRCHKQFERDISTTPAYVQRFSGHDEALGSAAVRRASMRTETGRVYGSTLELNDLEQFPSETDEPTDDVVH